MSEKITRRVFLKATGLTALSIAAASALGGCSGLSPLPGNPTLPEVTEPHVQLTNNIEVDLGALTGQWTGDQKQFESDGKHHNYLYTCLYLRNTGTTEITIKTTNFKKCTFGTTEMKVCSLGNITMDSDKLKYKFQTSATVQGGDTKRFPLYIDIGEVSPSDLISTNVDITLTAYNQTATFHYVNPNDENPTGKSTYTKTAESGS